MVEMRVLILFQVERVRVIQESSLLQKELIDMGVIKKESKVLEKMWKKFEGFCKYCCKHGHTAVNCTSKTQRTGGHSVDWNKEQPVEVLPVWKAWALQQKLPREEKEHGTSIVCWTDRAQCVYAKPHSASQNLDTQNRQQHIVISNQ
jgi:anion-transporting  ArsA/GET3 family ATPase